MFESNVVNGKLENIFIIGRISSKTDVNDFNFQQKYIEPSQEDPKLVWLFRKHDLGCFAEFLKQPHMHLQSSQPIMLYKNCRLRNFLHA